MGIILYECLMSACAANGSDIKLTREEKFHIYKQPCVILFTIKT